MQTPAMEVAARVEELERLARRRTQGVPVLCALLGEVKEGAEAWRAWAQRRGYGVLRAHSGNPQALARRWAEWALVQRDARAEAMPYLLAHCNTADARYARGVREMTRHERELFLARTTLPPDGAIARFYRALYLHAAPPADAWAWLEALANQGQALRTLAEVLMACLPQTGVPALLLAAPTDKSNNLQWLAQAAKTLGGLVSAHPELPAAVTVPPALFARYLAEAPESREKALLREGQVALDEAAAELNTLPLTVAAAHVEEELPPPGCLDNALRHLEAEGAGPEVLEACRAVAAATIERAPEEPRDEDRARSEAERFLYLLLATLPKTTGLFVLNETLPFGFGARATMEIDLLCQSLGIAIEIDGYFHFREPARYRSDRGKDYVLQQHGYLVLRFLADDVVAELEAIIERVTEAVELRRKRMA